MSKTEALKSFGEPFKKSVSYIINDRTLDSTSVHEFIWDKGDDEVIIAWYKKDSLPFIVYTKLKNRVFQGK